MFDPKKLTYKSQETLSAAAQLAYSQKNPAFEPIHLLHSLATSDGPVKELVAKLTDSQGVSNQVQQQIQKLLTHTDNSEPKMTSSLINVLQKAADLSKNNDEEYISQDILLLSLIENDPDTKQIFSNQQITPSDIKKEVEAMRQGNKANTPTSDTTYNVLDKYTLNLTHRAKDGKLDPVIGRDSEIRRVMQVLSRRTKNNPVLIGEPGVGKTAIVEGLAQRIYSGDVPESLKNKQLLVLDIASVLAGAKFRGEFEERLKAIIKQLTADPEKYIVFIDELHTIVGAGSAEGAVDASNMLKPQLARGELHLIGATTINEYRQHIEKDAALERRFQPVTVNEPTPPDSVSILRGLKEKYEVHHGLGISDEAIVAAVNLSSRYISDRFLPDKAIDLLDEAASGLKIQAQSKPESIDKLHRKITQLEIEKKALKGDKDSKPKIKEIDRQLQNLKDESKHLELKWENQKKQLEELSKVREEIDQLKIKLEEAERNVELDQAAKIKYGELPQRKKTLEELETKWSQIPQPDRLINDIVTAQDIASVISRWTKIPVSKLLDTEKQKLAHLEEELSKQVIGQKDAIKAVSGAIRRSRAGLSEEDKPIATFFFLGPTGVGKTETAKVLAQTLFNDQKSLIRIDMSEYSERHSIARLIGSPPGYVGYEQGGQLTEAVRRQPYSIILFDEVEKAHDDVFNIFLQIFDDGRLTDGKGRTVDFKNTVLIMTSNLGSKLISQNQGKVDTIQDQIWDVLKTKFPPEFLNRLDQIIVYDKLTKEEVIQIVDLELAKVEKRLKAQDYTLHVSDRAKQLLADQGFDDQYGARPLKRVIQNQILDEIATLITTDKIKQGHAITIDTKGKQFIFK